MTNRLSWFVIFWMALVFVFLYAPIVSVVVYSFNASRLVTVWGGFDTKWYGALFADSAIIVSRKSGGTRSDEVATTKSRTNAAPTGSSRRLISSRTEGGSARLRGAPRSARPCVRSG